MTSSPFESSPRVLLLVVVVVLAVDNQMFRMLVVLVQKLILEIDVHSFDVPNVSRMMLSFVITVRRAGKLITGQSTALIETIQILFLQKTDKVLCK